jgi:hypothetical protein
MEKEVDYKGDDGGNRYTVYVDSTKYGEHLKFSEAIRLFSMIEESGDKSE